MTQKATLLTGCGAEREIQIPDGRPLPDIVVPVRKFPEAVRFNSPVTPSMESNYRRRVLVFYGYHSNDCPVYRERVE